MCSLSGDDILEKKNEKKYINLRKCKKCDSSEAVIVLRKVDGYCKDCFMATTVHNFRAMLGKYRIVKPYDNVLIVHRTGHSSAALLHLIYRGLDSAHHKKFRFKPMFLFVDDIYSTANCRNKQFELLKNIYDQVSFYLFPLYCAPLNCLQGNISVDPECYEYFTYCEYIKKADVHTKNYKPVLIEKYQDLKEIYIRKLVINIAKKLNCNIVFTSETCIETAVGILKNIATGRGSQISINIGVLDERNADIKIFSPLRFFDMKEVVFYNHFNRVKIVSDYMTLNQKDTKTTVHNLMRKFVEDLQHDYPSTVKTITRTGDKLKCEKNNLVCKICEAPLENVYGIGTSEATQFSKWVSTKCSNETDQFFILSGNNDYCYSCKKFSQIIGDNVLL